MQTNLVGFMGNSFSFKQLQNRPKCTQFFITFSQISDMLASDIVIAFLWPKHEH